MPSNKEIKKRTDFKTKYRLTIFNDETLQEINTFFFIET